MGARNGPHPMHEVRLVYGVLGERVSNVFHIGELTPRAVHDQGIDLNAAILRWWQDGYGTGRPASYLLGYDAVLALEILRIAQLILDLPFIGDLLDIGLNGLAGEKCVPNSVSYAVEWTTGYSGRAMHGRTFLCGIPQGALDEGAENQLTGTFLNEVYKTYSSLVDFVWNLGHTPGDLTLALAHHKPVFPAHGPDPWWTPITGCRLPVSTVGSQRLRRPDYTAPPAIV